VLVGGALIIGAHHAFLFAGQRYVTGGVAAVLLGLVPVVTPALTRLVSTDEEFTVTTALGVVLGFVGVVVIADPGPTNIADSVLGVSLVLASALAFAIAAVVTHSRSPSMPFLSTQAWMMAIGAVVLHAAVLALPPASHSRPPRGRRPRSAHSRTSPRSPASAASCSTSRCWTISAPSR